MHILEKMPTLVQFLVAVTSASSDEDHPFLCTIASMILKYRSQRMCLVQQVLSILLYGNGTHKKVHL